MGYQRHQFDKEKRSAKPERKRSSEPNLREESINSKPGSTPTKPRATRSKITDPILKTLREYAPPSSDPLALELGALIEQYSHAFRPIHFSVALQALAMDANNSREHALGRQTAAKKLLGSLQACTSKFSMQENASIMKNLCILQITDPSVLKPFLRRAAKDCKYYSPLELSQCARAVVQARFLYEDIPPLVSHLFRRATEIFDEIDDNTVVHLVEHFGERRAFYKPFTDLVTERVLNNGAQLSIETLGQLCRGLALANSLQPELHAFIDQRVTNLASPKSLSPFSFEDARGIARCIRALEISGWRCSVNTLADFRDALLDHWHTYDYVNQQRLVREIAAVLADRDLPIPDVMQPFLSERANVFRLGSPSVSTFESSVGTVLEIIGATFEYSANRLCYELDFLITTKTGRVINLESDGDICHGVFDATSPSSEVTVEPRAEDIYRDKVLAKSDMPVVRLRYSQWRGLSQLEQIDLLQQLIPDL